MPLPHDIDDQKSVAMELPGFPQGLEIAGLLRDLLAASADCIKILDLDGRLLFMSEGGKRTMEVDDFPKILRCPWPEFWDGNERDIVRRCIEQAANGRSTQFYGYTRTFKGKMKYWDVQVMPLRDHSGRITHLLAISKDITRTKDADLEISRLMKRTRLQDTRFRILADAMPQMVWSTRPDGFHDYYNARWYEFTGMPHGSTDGDGWNGLFHPDDREHAWQKWRHSLTTGEPYDIEYRLRHHTGKYRWVLGRALPMRRTDGRIERWYGTCTDIHEAKLNSEQLALMESELRHRIKNVFMVIQGIIGLTVRAHPHAQEFALDLQGRLAALAHAHTLARPQDDGSGAPALLFKTLLLEILKPYHSGSEGSISISGPDISLKSDAATPVALLFHEMATNAAKYGALSTDHGHVDITIEVNAQQCEVTWCETGGPPIIEEPQRAGYGTKLAAVSAEGQLGGHIRRAWLPTGLQVSITWPLDRLTEEPLSS